MAPAVDAAANEGEVDANGAELSPQLIANLRDKVSFVHSSSLFLLINFTLAVS
jgi:hypothetical protein